MPQQATSITTWKRHVARVGERLDEEAHQRPAGHPVLNEFGLPTRNPLRAVGIDGGYVKASDAPSRQEAQPSTFLSDGGETVRQAQGEFREFCEPILDWLHIAMRATQLSQAIKSLAAEPPQEGDLPNRIEDCLRELRRAKAYLWHGSPYRALHTLEELTWDIGTESPRASELQGKLEEFINYIKQRGIDTELR